MKHKAMTVGTAVIISALSATGGHAAPGNSANHMGALPALPVGQLAVNPTVVQTGTLPTLSWNILYPSRVGDVAMITPPGTITLTKSMYVNVRAIGTHITDWTSGTSTTPTSAETRISINGGSYQQLFYGNNDDVNPTHLLYTKKLQAGTSIDFGGRYVKDYQWTPFYTTRSGNMQVISLVDGDTIPTSFDLNQSNRLAEYMKPYVDSTGTVDIGPLSVLVIGEYGSNNHTSASFDYQDFALLVTLSTKSNNGHGNNIDGVDSSNPGAGSGGPNGTEDPSGGVDDENP